MKTGNRDLCLILDGFDLQNEEDRNLVENLKLKMFIEFVLNKNGRYDKIVTIDEQVDFYFVGISSIQNAKKCIVQALKEFEATKHFVKMELL